MDFYYFGGNFDYGFVEKLDKAGFVGVMYTYDNTQGDFFTTLARDIKMYEKIKYLIAIRPYSISPQYLCMINKSVGEIMPNRLQINLISGHLKSHEEDVGGILGEVNDHSSNVDRSNYLIEYFRTLEKMKENKKNHVPDYYVSTTNKYVFNAASELKAKMIVSHRDYTNGCWPLSSEFHSIKPDEPFSAKGEKMLVCVSPILRKTQEEIDALDKPYLTSDTVYFTHDQFDHYVKQLEEDGITELMVFGYPEQERQIIIDYIGEYNKRKSV